MSDATITVRAPTGATHYVVEHTRQVAGGEYEYSICWHRVDGDRWHYWRSDNDNEYPGWAPAASRYRKPDEARASLVPVAAGEAPNPYAQWNPADTPNVTCNFGQEPFTVHVGDFTTETTVPVPGLHMSQHDMSVTPVAQAVAVPDGFVMVPVEPTQEMIFAGNSALPNSISTVYRAMLAAAKESAP